MRFLINFIVSVAIGTVSGVITSIPFYFDEVADFIGRDVSETVAMVLIIVGACIGTFVGLIAGGVKQSATNRQRRSEKESANAKELTQDLDNFKKYVQNLVSVSTSLFSDLHYYHGTLVEDSKKTINTYRTQMDIARNLVAKLQTAQGDNEVKMGE